MRGVEYCDERIYLWVCLYVCISVRLHISRSSSSGIAICYVLLVMWITSHLPFTAFHCQYSDVTASYWVCCIQWLAAPRLDESIVQGVLMNHCLVVDHFCCTRDFVIILLQPFNGLFSRTTWVSQYQKGKTNLDFTGARDSEWQWHQLGHMQVCTSLQTDNHASTPPLCFYGPDALPAAQPTASKHWRHFVIIALYKLTFTIPLLYHSCRLRGVLMQ